MSDSISSGAVPPSVIDHSSITNAASSTSSSSLWDRISSWASDNKATVYTIAGVTVVVSAGAIYYFNSQPAPVDEAAAERKKAKKDKKRAKKEAEKSEKAPAEKKAEEGENTACVIHQ